MSTPTPSPAHWAKATGEEDGLPTAYRFRTQRPDGIESSRYPHALQIVWPYDSADRTGMPTANIHTLQVKFERALQPISDGEDGLLMLICQGNGRKEWLYYVADPDAWVNRLNILVTGHETYPLEISHWPDATWDTWQGFADNVEA